MLKRTKGRLLLTLLVITGLAGTVHDSSLSQKERKQAITLLKSSRTDLLNNVKGLTTTQLRFKRTPGDLSIEDYIYSTLRSEMSYHERIKSSMEEPCSPERRIIVRCTDEQVKNLREAQDFPIRSILLHPNTRMAGMRTVDALLKFQSLRQEHIKYVRTSTEDMRNHLVQAAGEWMDSYQYMLALGAQTNYINFQINAIKLHPGFPKK
jgi:hypothetical protein